MDRFDRHEEEFLNANLIISRCVKRFGDASIAEERSRLWVEIEQEIAEAASFLSSMELEYNDMSPSEKRAVQQRLKSHKDGLKRLRDSIFKLKLIQGSTSIIESNNIAGNTLLSATQGSLDNATSTLESSRKLVADTEAVGGNVISDLYSQREKLLGAQGNVQTMQSSTATAKKVLSSMSSRALTLKVFLVFLNLLLACLIGMLVYYGLLKHKFS